MKQRNIEYENKFKKYLYSFDLKTYSDICKSINVVNSQLNIDDTKEVIFHDLECLQLKDTKENKYHYKLLKGNLKDLFKKLKCGE